MIPRTARLRSVVLATAPLGVVLLGGQLVHAACNIIPGTSKAFRGALGTIDRPFARPGDTVELRLDPTCHAASPGLPATVDAQVVTVVFTPPHGGFRRAVILATDCAALEGRRQACEAVPGVAAARCVAAEGAGESSSLQVVERDGVRRLRFQFPDTDDLVAGADDDLTLSGPAAIAVTRAEYSLPCSLATGPCATRTGLVACVDDLFVDDGSCGTVVERTFPHFTALPPANDYQAICVDPAPPCTGSLDDVRFAVDAAGNLLVPMDWRGILVERDAVPIARLLRASTSLEAFEGGGAPLRIPGPSFLGSFSPEGAKLPPLFDPQTDPMARDVATFFGTADAPETVLRVARRSSIFAACAGGEHDTLPCVEASDCPGGSCGPSRCVGGASVGEPCASDADCLEGECGPGLFDFSTRVVGGAGPVLLRLGACIGGANEGAACAGAADCAGGQCGDFRLAALDPVPLDGLTQTGTANAFVLAEAIAAADLNGDGDRTDDVVEFEDRLTGGLQPIGRGGSVGRAVVRIRQGMFNFPALAAEGDVLAFLEPELGEGYSDANANGSLLDTILRVFRRGVGTATALTVAADPEPLVSGRSLVVSDGQVFFRAPEAAAARQKTERLPVAVDGSRTSTLDYRSALSADARYVAFASDASDLVAGDTNGETDVFVRDRLTGTTERVSVATNGTQALFAVEPALSADGRYVAFRSFELVPGSSTGSEDVFVRDREAGVTERVSVATDGSQGNHLVSGAAAISADGRYVAFATGNILVPEDTNAVPDVYLRDRTSGRTERVSVATDGTQAEIASGAPAISADGRYVAFATASAELVSDDTNSSTDVFVRDRLAGVTVRVSVARDGREGNLLSSSPSLSADGRYVAFESFATNLVAGDTNGVEDVFVHDRDADGNGVFDEVGGTRDVRVSVAADGTQGNDQSLRPSLSADGRWVIFLSRASNLVPDDADGQIGVYVHDRLTGLTAHLGSTGGSSDGLVNTPAPTLSADGRYAAFLSRAPLVLPDGDGLDDLFVHGPDPADATTDVTGDGDTDDTTLAMLDPGTGALRTVCPAGAVAVAGSAAAFLRPEAAGDAPGCPPGPDLNRDGDITDEVVHLAAVGAPVQNLGRAAKAIALSTDWLAALVPEEGQGSGDLNGDGDTADTALQVHRLTDDAESWRNVGQAADAVAVVGSVVAFLTPEAAQGYDLNGDGDIDDRVLQTYRADTGELLNTGRAAEEMVAGGEVGRELVAFRTREAAQGGTDLNGDGDASDDVLGVVDLAAGRVLDTMQAVTPCRLEACDPHVPYRVGRDTVTFLTFEPDQGRDLNGDEDEDDLVLQVLNVRRLARTGTPAGACYMLAAVSAGVCTNTGHACATDAGCGCPVGVTCQPGTCFVPPGGCLKDLGTPCDPQARPAAAGACAAGQFCNPVPGAAGRGACKEVQGPCGSTADCADPAATCNNAGQQVQRLASPLAATSDGAGSKVFTSAGTCVDSVGSERGSCRTDADCPLGALCRADIVVSTAADSDGDEVPDAFDLCPTVPDVLQEDSDGDGVGDACEPQPSCTTVNDSRARVVVRAGRRYASLRARLVIQLPAYHGERVTLGLANLDATPIVSESVGPLRAGRKGSRRRWVARTGRLRVVLKDLGRKHPGAFRVVVRAGRWLGAADSDAVVAGTRLSIRVGGQCFTHTVTRKIVRGKPRRGRRMPAPLSVNLSAERAIRPGGDQS